VSLIGHNGGPGTGGGGWSRYCWGRARADLFPKLPLEVVRLRVKRAAEIGLDYRTYAGIRATTGHDLAAFLYSSNILRLLRSGEAEAARLAKLAALQGIGQSLAVQPPHAPEALQAALAAQGLCVDKAAAAPSLSLSPRETRARLAALRGRIAPDRVLVIGETGLELEWAVIGRMAGALPATEFFARG